MQLYSFFTRKPAHSILMLAVLQALSSTYFLQITGFERINSIVFALSGFGIGLLILKVKTTAVKRSNLFNGSTLLKLLCLVLLLPFSYAVARDIMDHTPLRIEYADMLPIMKVMVTRFLSGQWAHVYDPIPEIWGGMQPVYLPAMWLPHVFSNLLDFDMRWITVSGIWSCVLLCLWPGKWRHFISFSLCALGFVAVLDWHHFEKTNNVIRLTEEGVVFFYYSLLAVAIICRSAWLTGAAAALCLLSRYALVGWLPFAAIYLLYAKEYRFFTQAALSGTAVCLLLLFPFGAKPLVLHLHQPGMYVAFAEKIWRETPEFFHHSVGLAKFFGPGNVRLQHTILMLGAFVLPLIFLLVIRKKKISVNVVLLSGLQLSVNFFYNFIDVSYIYLYYTPVCMSLAIAAWLFAAGGNENLNTTA